MTPWLETRADLIRWIKSFGVVGLPVDAASREGLMIEAIRIDLIRAGYGARIEGEGDERHLHLTENPAVGAKKRKSQWLALGDDHK